MRGTLYRLRRAAHVAGLAVLCALLGAASAQADWQPAQPIDNGGAGYGGTQTSALAVAPGSPTSALFFQSAPGPTSGSSVLAPFMVRRDPGASTSWSAPARVAVTGGFPSPSLGLSLAAASGGPLGAGGALGLFGFTSSSGGQSIVSTNWPAPASAPSAAAPALCTSDVRPECAGGAGPIQVAFDGTGNGYGVGHTVSSTGTDDLLFARFDPGAGSWGPAQIIAHGQNPQLAVDPAGDAVVTYTNQDSSAPPGVVLVHEYAIRQPAGQASFDSPHQISGPNTVAQGQLVIDGAGTATALFKEDTVPPSIFQGVQAPVMEAVRWPLAQAQPGPEQQVSGSPTDEGLETDPAMAVDPQGRVTAAWSGLTPTGGHIFAAQYVNGSWQAPQQASPTDGRTASTPKVAADAAGTATIAYTDNSPSNNDGDAKVMFKPLGGSWSTPVSVRSRANGTGTVQSASARVAVSGPGQIDVTFLQQLNGTNRLFATRFIDTTPPTITLIVPQDGATYRQGATVVADYSCADEPGGSGLASCQGPVPTGQPADTGTPGTKTFTVTATDNVGNTTSKTVDYTVKAGPPPADKTAPSITITSPRNGARYTQGQRVIARYRCTDPDSPVTVCKGPVKFGGLVNTRKLGPHTFSVVAQDPSGNTAGKTVRYTVVKRRTVLRLRLSVRPRRAITGHRLTFRFTVKGCIRGRCHRLAGARVSFAGHRARSDRRGIVRLTISFARPGRYRARAREPGSRDGTTIVTVRRRGR